MQDPEKYLNQLQITLPGAVDSDAAAVVDGDHKRYVNWEVFFFSSREMRGKFEGAPLEYCGVVTDPVTKVRFRPDTQSPRFDYEGRPYYFTSRATMEQFRSMPAALADPNLEMHKDPGDG